MSCSKWRILVTNDGPQGPKHVAFVDYIIKIFVVFDSNTYINTDMSQHMGTNYITINF
jgi:hypothetical protein